MKSRCKAGYIRQNYLLWRCLYEVKVEKTTQILLYAFRDM